MTIGGTLCDLKDYIESKGGKVVAVSTLSASAGGTKLTPTEEQIKELEQYGFTTKTETSTGTRALVNAGANQSWTRGREASGRDNEPTSSRGDSKSQIAEQLRQLGNAPIPLVTRFKLSII